MSYRSERSVKRETLELIAALADDTARKMQGETAEDPDAEFQYDRGYLLEDLLMRLGTLCAEHVPDFAQLFPAAADNRPTPAYELLIGESSVTEAESQYPPARGVASIPVGHVGPTSARPIVSEETIRQAHNLLHFDGVQRHPFEVGAHGTGMACTRMVERGGYGEDCGLPAAHAIHDWQDPR